MIRSLKDVTKMDTETKQTEIELDDDALQLLVLEAQEEALANKQTSERKHRKVPKWFIWLMSIILISQSFAFIFQIYSIPAITFLKTSAQLSLNAEIRELKKAVVVVSTSDSKGTGFSFRSDGWIMTNNHVVDTKDRVQVLFPDEGRFDATVVKRFPQNDIAILHVEADHLPALTLASEIPKHGDKIRFIGNPLSFNGIVNEGQLLEPILLDQWPHEVMMMEAPVYRGNSGSPVFNKKNEVIGVIFATLQHDQYGTVGLYIPIDEIHRLIENL